MKAFGDKPNPLEKSVCIVTAHCIFIYSFISNSIFLGFKSCKET